MRSSRRASRFHSVARHESTLQHICPGGLKRRLSVAPRAWKTGRAQYRSRQCEAASCTSSNGAAPSETGGRRGRSVTVLQEGSTSCSQGRTQSAPTGALEQKKSRHGCSGRGQWQHHASLACNTPTSQYSGNLLPHRLLTSSFMVHVCPWYCPLTLFHHIHIRARINREHGTSLITRACRRKLSAAGTGTIAEQKAGVACRGEEVFSGAVQRRGMQSTAS